MSSLPCILIKFAWLLIHFLNAGLIYQIAKSTAADPRYALFVFAFNPLILLEELANGHNDGPLILFGLLAVLAVQRGRGGLAIVAGPSLGARQDLRPLLGRRHRGAADPAAALA